MSQHTLHPASGGLRALLLVLVTACAAAQASAAAPDPAAGTRWFIAPFAEVRTAAEKGEAAAQYALGERLLRGRDGKTDLVEAYRWFGSAGSNGVVEAQLRMGMKHERAVGGPRDISEAARWYQLAASQGSEAAQFRLACIHSLNRYAGRLDGNETLRWIGPLAERGHGPAVQLRGVAISVLGATNAPPNQRAAWLRAAAELGAFTEHVRLAEFLARGDPKEAAYWWEVSRRNGATNVSIQVAHAQARLSDAELAEVKVRAQDFKVKTAAIVPLPGLDALHHVDVELQPTGASRAELVRLESAAKTGDAEAQFQLALAHQLAPAFTNHLAALDGSRRSGNSVLLNNDRVPQPHLEAALRWHTAAAKQGHGGAAFCLVWLYSSGAMNTVRIAEAMPWLKVAGEAGHAESAYLYAIRRLEGVGVEQPADPAVMHRSYQEAMQAMHHAAELGWLPAQTNLAERMYSAAGANMQFGNQTRALRMLREAADKGDAGAKDRLLRWFGVSHRGPVKTEPATAVPPAGGSPRLAIVPLVASVQPLAELLTAELSAKPGLIMVERGEIDRVLREQTLGAMNLNALKLGELLNAQGLILLETNALANGVLASVRLVAVGPGVLLSTAEVPLPLTNALDWSRRLTAQFSPWLGKLGVRRDAAVPISLLGVRMATASPDRMEIEQGFSLVFLHRLTHEREVLVLERRRLEQLSRELELGERDESAFWSGSHLVEGSIERNSTNRTHLNVRLRLTPAGGTELDLEVSGAQTNLAALADALTLKLLATLNKQASRAWNPQEEAVKYYEEAVWLGKWGQWRAALEAMESAWALGLRGPVHATLRQEALLGSLQFRELQWHGTVDYPPVLRQPPDAANLEYAERALQAFLSFSRMRSPDELAQSQAWLAKGEAAISKAAQVLGEFYHAPEERRDFGDRLAGLRSTTRETVAFLETITNAVMNLDNLKVNYGRFWFESPDEVIALHRRLMRHPAFPLWRDRFATVPPSPLVAWRPAERPGLKEKWQTYLDSLVNSTNAAEQLEGLLGKLLKPGGVDLSDPPPLETQLAIRRLTDAAWTHREALLAGKLAPHTWQNLREACFSRLKGSFGGMRLAQPEVGEFFKPLDDRMRDYASSLGTAPALEFLRTSKADNQELFLERVTLPNFTGAQAGEILAEVDRYAKRLWPSVFGLEPRIARLRQLTNAQAPPTVSIPPAAGVKGATSASVTPPVVSPVLDTPSPDALRVTNFWLAPELRRPVQSLVQFPLPAGHSIQSRNLDIQDWAWREGRLWVAWRHNISVNLGPDGGGYWRQGCSHVASYSLPDLAGDLSPDSLPPELALPDTTHLHAARFEELFPRVFEVIDGRVYVAGTDGVWEFAKPAWRKLPVEISGRPRMIAAHGRLIISLSDALYSYEPKEGTVTLLVSARRRPALNMLDGTSALRLAVGGPVGTTRLRVAFGNVGAYDYDFESKVWTYLALSGERSRWLSDRLESVRRDGNDVFYSSFLSHDGTNSRLAAFRLPPPPRSGQALSNGIKIPAVPLWQPADGTLSPAGLATGAMSNRLWSIDGLNFQLGATDADTRMQSTNGHHVRLAAWHPELKQPAVVPLWLELPPGALTREAVVRSRSRHSFERLADAAGELLATPLGLVYRHEASPGFWFIAWGEVLPRVESQFAQFALARDARPKPADGDRVNQWLHTYDADGDGKLSAVEFAVLESVEKLDAGTSGGSMFRSRISVADKNRDGSLDHAELDEFDKFLKDPPRYGPGMAFGPPGFRPPGFPGAIGTNGQPMLPGFPGRAGQMLRPGQLPEGPPPPEILERYDKNKNGKMDPDEMQEFLRDRARGTSPRPRTTNAPPVAPVPTVPPKP